MLQDGLLQKSMKHISTKGQHAVAVKDLVGTLASGTHDSMDVIAKELSVDKHPCLENTKDVTMDFLVVPRVNGPDICKCDYFLYRGLIQGLLGHADNAKRLQYLGLMGGTDQCVLDVILAENLQCVLSSPELIQRWNNLKYEPMGIVVWDNDEKPYAYKEQMQELMMNKDNGKPLLLVIFGASHEPCSWHFDADEQVFIAVDLASKTGNRRKNADYHIIRFDQLGVTFEDEAQYLVSQAICSQISKAIENHDATTKGKLTPFRKVAVPPDGYCFWHSILAGLQPDAFCRIPRHDNGFAKHQRQERIESSAAKQLLQLVAKQGINPDRFHNGFVDLRDIAAVANACNLAVRCTIAPEAGLVVEEIYILSARNSYI